MEDPKRVQVVAQPTSDSDIENNHVKVTDVAGTHQVSSRTK
jgi:hypothetical protein